MSAIIIFMKNTIAQFIAYTNKRPAQLSSGDRILGNTDVYLYTLSLLKRKMPYIVQILPRIFCLA